jgi:hypothetical protein
MSVSTALNRELERRLESVQSCDPYAGTGCFSAAASLANISKP